jgi:predicted membrane-bound spermidine synthase
LNVTAAGAALLAARGLLPGLAPAGGHRIEAVAPAPSALRPRRAALAAAFAAGAALLALETVWFRFLQLFVPSTSTAFAVMLAVVLLGIGAGGLLASAWARRAEADRFLGLVCVLAGVSVVVTYAAFGAASTSRPGYSLVTTADTFAMSVRLMLPTSVASGVLFTLLGRSLQKQEKDETRATGLLTLANTVGAAAGALLAGFVLLPSLGMERSLFLLAAAYAVVWALSLAILPRPGVRRRLEAATGAVLLIALALFPFGLMDRRFLPMVAAKWAGEGSRLMAVREGLTETVVLLRKDLLGQPLSYTLVTNGAGMSGTTKAALRYMAAFVWVPVAVHPDPRRALLISYGCGTTARALTETRGLEAIDVVDISRGVLDMSPLVHPPPARDPLSDPRVTVHVEDGRFHLLASGARYDVITAEPPPLKFAGIVNLYSREYFGLLKHRLAEGGIVSYWLPIAHVTPRETRSVIGAFCAVFDDCSLWTTWGAEWMLVGSRGAKGPVSAETFSRQWSDPAVGARLRDSGLETPEQMGAMFLADASTLRPIAAEAPVLEDDRPHLLSPRVVTNPQDPFFVQLMDTRGTRDRFARSDLVRRWWPPELRERTLSWFGVQEALNEYFMAMDGFGPSASLRDLEPIVTGTSLRTAVLWLMGSSPAEQRLSDQAASRGVADPLQDLVLGVRHLADRRYEEADKALARAEGRVGSGHPHLRTWRILARASAGDRAGAAALLAESGALRRRWAQDGAWEWLAQRFGLPLPDPSEPAG